MRERLVKTLIDTGSSMNLIKAFNMLEEGGKINSLSEIIPFSKHRDPPVRLAANKAVSNILKKSLLQNWSGMDSGVRKGLAKILQTMDPGVVDSIAQDLQSENEQYRIRCVSILGLMGQNPRVKELLIPLLQDHSSKIRATAVILMRELAQSSDLTLFGKMLNDKDHRVVANCIEVLEAIGDHRLIPLLLKFTRHPNNRVRGNVLKALWNLGHQEILEELKIMMEDPDDPFPRASACWTAGQILPPEHLALEWLGDRLSDEDQMVRTNAIKSLIKIGGPKSGELLKNALNQLEIQKIRFENKI